jgi:hypothetical protein
MYVHQKDAISIYIVNEFDELDLVFQFRDTINRVQFESVDVSSHDGYMVMVTSESLNRRGLLELFDLSLVKAKCPSLTPIMRYDVSRLVLGGACKTRFFHTDRERTLEFVITVPDNEGTVGMVWECVPRDKWSAFMPSFKALNMNMPYAESEEEFDFNQEEEDKKKIHRTISRYSPDGGIDLKFFEPPAQAFQLVKCGNDYIGTKSSKSGCTPHVYPFLQPGGTWGTRKEIHRASGLSTHASSEFFSPACGKALKVALG